MIKEEKTKSLPITKLMVWKAYQKVKRNGGSAGVDGESLILFQQDLSKNLYKIWNRLSSGSYFPPAVKEVSIPKSDGRERKLGIPTVGDRIAQEVIKCYLEPRLEAVFVDNSYGYRPLKSAHQAVEAVRMNVRQYAWVVDMDIKSFFDEVDHDLLMKALDCQVTEPWVKLYIKRWLEAPVLLKTGEYKIKSGRGTPQGGVVALRTHSQTLSLPEALKLTEENLYDFIKSIIFMKYGTISKLGNSETCQSCLYPAAKGTRVAADRRKTGRTLRHIPGAGLSLREPCKRDHRKNVHTGEFCSIYSQTPPVTDYTDKEIIRCERINHQQSGTHCLGRIFSKTGSWQKRRNKLRYPLLMTGCGSKSSLRRTISLSHLSRQFSQNKVVKN